MGDSYRNNRGSIQSWATTPSRSHPDRPQVQYRMAAVSRHRNYHSELATSIGLEANHRVIQAIFDSRTGSSNLVPSSNSSLFPHRTTCNRVPSQTRNKRRRFKISNSRLYRDRDGNSVWLGSTDLRSICTVNNIPHPNEMARWNRRRYWPNTHTLGSSNSGQVASKDQTLRIAYT